MGSLSRFFLAIVAASLSAFANAQNSTAVDLSVPLLPQSFGEWKAAGNPIANDTTPLSLSNASKAAMQECGPERSQVVHYERNEGGRTREITVEAVQFGDRTGAYSAYTLVRPVAAKEGKELGTLDAVAPGAIVFTRSSSLVVVYPAAAADIPSLKPLAEALPKAAGNKGVAPLLPTFLLDRGLVNSSVRYAVGPATYAAQGGVLPANSIGWDKSAEAITASYDDRRGKETLTLLIYPTPDIARAKEKMVAGMLQSMGPSFANAKLRHEAELVVLANGTFSPDEAQRMVENVHMKQEVSIDKDVQPVFHTEVQKTASLLLNIAVLFGILALAAIVLGFFLGGGRAMVRIMRGKSAAAEPEFLSLHLDPQNKPVYFERS